MESKSHIFIALDSIHLVKRVSNNHLIQEGLSLNFPKDTNYIDYLLNNSLKYCNIKIITYDFIFKHKRRLSLFYSLIYQSQSHSSYKQTLSWLPLTII